MKLATVRKAATAAVALAGTVATAGLVHGWALLICDSVLAVGGVYGVWRVNNADDKSPADPGHGVG